MVKGSCCEPGVKFQQDTCPVEILSDWPLWVICQSGRFLASAHRVVLDIAMATAGDLCLYFTGFAWVVDGRIFFACGLYSIKQNPRPKLTAAGQARKATATLPANPCEGRAYSKPNQALALLTPWTHFFRFFFWRRDPNREDEACKNTRAPLDWR